MNNEIFKKERILLIITAIISVFVIFFHFIEDDIGFLTLVSGIQLVMTIYTISSMKDIESFNRNIIICIILSCLHINIPNIVILIWAKESMENTLYSMNAPPNKFTQQNIKVESKKIFEEEKISDEAKKIDILLKIGVFLVVLSGILFSTSSTGPVIDLFKPFFVLILSGIFYGLSYIFKTKVKIKKSENTYYILSNLFLIFFAVALAYFKTFGEFLSFEGKGAEIVWSFISLLSALVIRNLGNKYEKETLKVSSYMIVYLALAFALSYFKASNILIISILLIISIIGNAKIDKNNSSYHTSKFILILLLGFLVIIYNMFAITQLDELFNGLLSAGLLVVNLYFLAQDKNLKEDRMLYSYVTYFLIITSVINILSVIFPATYVEEKITNAYVYTSIISLIAHHYFNKIEDLKYGGFVLTSIILAYSMIMMAFNSCSILLFITSTTLLGYSVWNIYKNNDEILQKIYFGLQLILMMIVIGSGVSVLNTHFNVSITAATAVLSYVCIAALIDIVEDKYITKIKIDLVLYYVIISTLSALSVILMFSNSILFNLIVLAILIGYRLYVNKYIKNIDIMNCVILLATLCHLEYTLYQLIPNIAHPLMLIIFVVIGYLTRKDKVTSMFSLWLAYLPYVLMINQFNIINDYQSILMTAPVFILISMTSSTLLDMPRKSKNIIETIALMFVMLLLIFKVSLVIGLYVGIISLAMIFIGTKNSKYNSLFYTGIISLILNIIVQLQEFWSKIPWFVYTLIAGLAIIFYVTYKEFNKDKKEKIIDNKVEYYEEKQYDTRINIVTLILCISYIIAAGIYMSINYEIQTLNENKVVFNKFKSLNLDENKYTMLIEEVDYIYILKGNTIDIKKIYNDLDVDHITACWVDEEEFQKIKQNYNKYYYYGCYESVYYDKNTELPSKTYLKNGFELKILNNPINVLDVYDRYNSFEDKTTFEIYYNDYEMDSISFCINKYDIDDYSINIYADNGLEEIEGIGKCYKVSSDYRVQVDINRNKIYQENEITDKIEDEFYN